MQLEAAYDLLWPIVTTKWYIPLRKGSLTLLHSLVVTVGHNKSYVGSRCVSHNLIGPWIGPAIVISLATETLLTQRNNVYSLLCFLWPQAATNATMTLKLINICCYRPNTWNSAIFMFLWQLVNIWKHVNFIS